jgi:hypothetical protein
MLNIDGKLFSFCKNPLDIVGPDWYYSYDGGGITMIIPDSQPVWLDAIGKTAQEASLLSWEYFLVPKKIEVNCG